MLYNKDVTKIHIYVMKSISKEPVSGLVESYVKEFATTGCPKYTRETVAEFEVLDPPHSKFNNDLKDPQNNMTKSHYLPSILLSIKMGSTKSGSSTRILQYIMY